MLYAIVEIQYMCLLFGYSKACSLRILDPCRVLYGPLLSCYILQSRLDVGKESELHRTATDLIMIGIRRRQCSYRQCSYRPICITKNIPGPTQHRTSDAGVLINIKTNIRKITSAPSDQYRKIPAYLICKSLIDAIHNFSM